MILVIVDKIPNTSNPINCLKNVRRGVFKLNLTLELNNNNGSTFYPFVLEQNSQQIQF
jgi:hypothetical protein